MVALQDLFLRTRGDPLQIDGSVVVQMDRLQIRKARVTVSAARAFDGQGIALKTPNGHIKLGDGREVPLLHIWFDKGLPLTASHDVDCKGELRVWNIYRTGHPGGAVTEDAWTGNAGMIMTDESLSRRRYLCSAGTARTFDPQLDVTIQWEATP